jgi:hypothetical protein
VGKGRGGGGRASPVGFSWLTTASVASNMAPAMFRKDARTSAFCRGEVMKRPPAQPHSASPSWAEFACRSVASEARFNPIPREPTVRAGTAAERTTHGASMCVNPSPASFPGRSEV